jgi:hypothetical protein
MVFEVSSNDFASTIGAMVGIEVPEVPDEQMVDYEATPERREVNVVVLSTDYYIVEDDSATAVFNFPIQDATFKKPEQLVKMPYLLYKKLRGQDQHDDHWCWRRCSYPS